MRLVKQSHKILTELNEEKILKELEYIGRTAYQSFEKTSEDSAKKFIEMIIKNNHLAVIEHFNISVKFITSRGVSHELVRHRIASYVQSSTRYCNYSKDKFGSELTFVIPEWFTENVPENLTELTLNGFITDWLFAKTGTVERVSDADYPAEFTVLKNYAEIEKNYMYLTTKKGLQAQQARGILPNDLMTEIVVTANLREWIHILQLRTSKAAHPAIRNLMQNLLVELKEKLPVIFENVEENR